MLSLAGAMLLGAIPAQAAQPTSLVGACTGAALSPSVVTTILGPVLTNGIVSPLQNILNPVLRGLLPGFGGLGPVNVQLAAALLSASRGNPVRINVLDNNNTLLGPNAACNTQTDSLQLSAPAGISIGGNRITGLGANNQDAIAGELNSIAFGNNAQTAGGATNAVAIGTNANVTAANSVALGANSVASRGANVGYTAPGIATTVTSAGEVSVGSAGALRQITNVAAGSAPTDAATVGQVTGATANAVQYTVDGAGNRTNVVSLVGGVPGAVRIGNVAPGALTATSNEAVNGAQLFATNGQVATNTSDILTNTTNIAGNTASITNLTTGINGGTIGLLRQTGGSPGVGILTVGATTGGTNVDFTGTGGARTLSGVANGVATTDAVNLSQLNGAVGTATVNAVNYDVDALGNRTNRVTLVGGTAGAPVIIGNVAPGELSATSTEAVNGAQLFATNGQVTENTTAILNVSTGINNGTLGLVRQAGGSPGIGAITVGATTAGTVVDVSGTAGTRIIAGVSAGAAATDAVNFAQLQAVGAVAGNAVQYDTDGAGNRTNQVTLAGGVAGAPVKVANVANGLLSATSNDAVNGGQLFATNAQVATNTTNIATNTSNIATNTTNIAGNTTAITNLTSGINSGTVGLVQQTGGSPGTGQVTVAANTGGTSVSVAGTDGNRVVTGLAAGLAANDAATVGQLGQVTGGAFNAIQYDTDANGGRLNTVTLTGGTAAPVKITNVADGTLAAGSTDAVTGGQLATTNGGLAATNVNVANNTTQIASNTTAIAGNTTTINAVVAGQAGAFRSNNAAGAAAPSATGANATAGGFGAAATGARSVALGNGATASGLNSVAIGAGSTDGGASNVVSVGAAGSERRLTNVAPGVAATDAVNFAQLQSATTQFGSTAAGLQTQIDTLGFDLRKVRRDSNAATAGAMAVAALPQAFTPGAGMIAGGIGEWRGEVAFAFGASKIVGDQTVLKAGASVNTRGDGGFNAGVGYQF